jgi:hypothetical protein
VTACTSARASRAGGARGHAKSAQRDRQFVRLCTFVVLPVVVVVSLVEQSIAVGAAG